MIHGVFPLICMAPVLYVTANSSRLNFESQACPLIWSDYIGFAIFANGLLFESLGDEQLKAHLNDEDPNKGKFCKRGLWRYTRYPN